MQTTNTQIELGKALRYAHDPLLSEESRMEWAKTADALREEAEREKQPRTVLVHINVEVPSTVTNPDLAGLVTSEINTLLNASKSPFLRLAVVALAEEI